MRILLVGNKEIETHMSGDVESFDMVVRYNKMDNLSKTGTRTDMYCYFGNLPHLLEHISDESLQIIEQTKRRALNDFWWRLNMRKYPRELREFISDDAKRDCLMWNEHDVIERLSLEYDFEHVRRYQSGMRLLLFLMAYFPDDEIYVTAFDLDRRYFDGHHWHKYGDEERTLIERFINKRFTYLPCE